MDCTIGLAQAGTALLVPAAALQDARARGQQIYVLDYAGTPADRSAETLAETLAALELLGETLPATPQGTNGAADAVAAAAVFATVLGPELVAEACELDPACIRDLSEVEPAAQLSWDVLPAVAGEAPVQRSDAAPDAAPRSAEDLQLLTDFCMEVEDLLTGLEDNISRIRPFVFRQPYEYGDLVGFLSGVEVAEFLEAMRGVNRFLHTLKGNSGFLELTRLNRYCHAMEELTIGIAEGSLYLSEPAYEMISQVPAVIARIVERVERDHSDASLSVDRELEEVQLLRQELGKAMGTTRIDLTTFTKADLGQVRKSAPKLKVSMDLRVHDDLVQDFQGQVHNIISLLGTRGLDSETVLDVGATLNDHLDRLLMSAQSPIVLSRYHRIVNDLGRALGKKVELRVTTNAAQARPDVWDHCHNALVHLVRNAVDHGIELPAARTEHGKPAQGTITLDLWEDHKSIYIELQDDGGGIDPEKVGQLAVERGLVTREQLAELSPSAIQKLIFHAGFTTKAQATDVSGRGVGMDAVLKEIETNLGGTLQLDSELVRGTRIAIELPKAETLTECVFFGDGEIQYAIPKVADIEYMDCDPRYVRTAFGENPMLTRGPVAIPLVHVMRLLNPERYPEPSLDGFTVIKIGGRDGHYGLAVPEVFGHRRVKLERKKAFGRVFSDDGVVFGYGLSDPVTVVLDLDRLESLV